MAAVNIIQYIWRNIYVVGGVPKKSKFAISLGWSPRGSNRFYCKIWSFKSIHMAIWFCACPPFITNQVFVLNDWIGKMLGLPHKWSIVGTFLISLRGSSILYLCSIITATSAWFPKRKKKKIKAQWWWSSGMSCTSAFFSETAVKSNLHL